MTKMLSASGASPPLPPDQGLCPWTPLGALPPDPRYRRVLRTRHGAPPTTDPFRRLCLEVLNFRKTVAIKGHRYFPIYVYTQRN